MTEEKKFLTAKEILDAKDATTEDVFVEEWGGYVHLQSLMADQAVVSQDEEDKAEQGALMLAMSARDPKTGALLFTKEHVKKLRKKNMSAIATLQRAALRLNGMLEKDEPETKKDSDEDQPVDTPSA